jgi:hypothetical protein
MSLKLECVLMEVPTKAEVDAANLDQLKRWVKLLPLELTTSEQVIFEHIKKRLAEIDK